VSLDLASAFNEALVLCVAQGKEFSEMYPSRIPYYRPAAYNWYTCTGPSTAVGTEFKMVWWTERELEIRQTWTCPNTGYIFLFPLPLSCYFNFPLSVSVPVSLPPSANRRRMNMFTTIQTCDARLHQDEPPMPGQLRFQPAAFTAIPKWNVFSFKWVTQTKNHPSTRPYT
jgi:hypothetical protein